MHSEMEQDLFKFLPSEIILNILSRLPIRTTMICKCVCKPWLELLVTPEFVKCHLSKSVPYLAVETRSKSCKALEFVDDRRSKSAFDFKLPFGEPMRSSVDGLLFLGGCFYHGGGDLILCNPVTRDCITLPHPQQPFSEHRRRILVESYGFGVSRVTNQYKVVEIFIRPSPGVKCDQFECQVYTVGTGSWREIARDSPLRFFEDKQGVFLNGNLHWLVLKSETNSFFGRISCLDLETEVFSNFSPPPDINVLTTFRKLSVLRDSLCVCDSSDGGQYGHFRIEIWLMKEYGDEKSWTKEFIIPSVYMANWQPVWPIKVFEDGDILMQWGRGHLLYYSSKTKTSHVEVLSEDEEHRYTFSCIYAPSFLPLKNFAVEDVSSF